MHFIALSSILLFCLSVSIVAFQRSYATTSRIFSSGSAKSFGTILFHHDGQNSFEISRREAANVAVAGSFLAAALAGGAPPALAADIAKQMAALEKEFAGSANSNGAPEKHIPKVSLTSVKGNSDLSMVEVSVPHVMDAEKPHWIQAIWLKEESSGEVAVAKVLPATEPSPPSLTCGVPKGVKLTPYIYCNLHGLWRGDSFTA